MWGPSMNPKPKERKSKGIVLEEGAKCLLQGRVVMNL